LRPLRRTAGCKRTSYDKHLLCHPAAAPAVGYIYRFISVPQYRRGAPIVHRSRNDYYSVLSADERIKPPSHGCTRVDKLSVAHLVDHAVVGPSSCQTLSGKGRIRVARQFWPAECPSKHQIKIRPGADNSCCTKRN